jgi:drug/metabolite transporter (DMT)-like permease
MISEFGYYTGVIGGAFMYFLYNWSVTVLGASRAGTLIYTQGVMNSNFAAPTIKTQ